jgi:hypothetical protein
MPKDNLLKQALASLPDVPLRIGVTHLNRTRRRRCTEIHSAAVQAVETGRTRADGSPVGIAASFPYLDLLWSRRHDPAGPGGEQEMNTRLQLTQH